MKCFEVKENIKVKGMCINHLYSIKINTGFIHLMVYVQEVVYGYLISYHQFKFSDMEADSECHKDAIFLCDLLSRLRLSTLYTV